MLVYGIRCSPSDLPSLPSDATADYYLDYSLLVFPSYTSSLCLKANTLNADFWYKVRRVTQFSKQVSVIDKEQPWITDEESSVVRAIQQAYPSVKPDWYYVPRLATNA